MSGDRRPATGRLGEQAACRYLLAQGYHILHTNWRCRLGELDIVAEDGDMLVFVEVRTRSTGGRFGLPLESVDWRKQRKVMQVALTYVQANRLQQRRMRFDAVGVLLPTDGGEPELKHIRGAFS